MRQSEARRFVVYLTRLQFSVQTMKHRLDRPKRDSSCSKLTFLVTFEENGLRLKDKHNIVGIRSLNFFGILRTQELVRLANFLENVLERNMEEKLINVSCGAQLNSRHCWKDKTRDFFFLWGLIPPSTSTVLHTI